MKLSMRDILSKCEQLQRMVTRKLWQWIVRWNEGSSTKHSSLIKSKNIKRLEWNLWSFKFCLRLTLAFDSAYFFSYEFYSNHVIVNLLFPVFNIYLLLDLNWPLEHFLFRHLVRLFLSEPRKDLLLILSKFKCWSNNL